jgi:hypothetical protein
VEKEGSSNANSKCSFLSNSFVNDLLLVEGVRSCTEGSGKISIFQNVIGGPRDVQRPEKYSKCMNQSPQEKRA